MDLRSLYQEVIIDHNKSPRNYYDMAAHDRKSEGFNPLCGDRVTVFLKMKDDVVLDASFQGTGCAISIASASIMTEMLHGKTEDEVKLLFDQFHQMVTCDSCDCDLGKLEVLAGVKEFPSRVKCATLAWHTLSAALENDHHAVTTE